MVYEHYDSEIRKLNLRVEELTKEIDSLRNEIKSKTIEKNIYETSSTVSEDTTWNDMDMDYGQQSF